MGKQARIDIDWYGQSYVLVNFAGDVRVAIDPHDGGSLNFPEFRVEADYVLVTHDHYDHNAVEMVKLSDKRGLLKEFRGETHLGPVRLLGFKTYHDKAAGRIRGENTVYLLEYEGLRIVHMGDIGHLPGEKLLDSIRGVEVLMLPVGGVYTIDAYEAWRIVEAVKPRIVLPLHYWIPYSTAPLDPLDVFLDVAKAGRMRLPSNRLSISSESLPEKTAIAVPRVPLGESKSEPSKAEM